jgi:hypothetical protein
MKAAKLEKSNPRESSDWAEIASTEEAEEDFIDPGVRAARSRMKRSVASKRIVLAQADGFKARSPESGYPRHARFDHIAAGFPTANHCLKVP